MGTARIWERGERGHSEEDSVASLPERWQQATDGYLRARRWMMGGDSRWRVWAYRPTGKWSGALP